MTDFSIIVKSPLHCSVTNSEQCKFVEAESQSSADEIGLDYLNRQALYTNQSGLKKDLTGLQLISIGIGATIGAGIFVVTGVVARDKTGPALCLSYIVSGIACLISAFSYAEFASMAPTAGSAYGFTRATLGPFAGWVIGWDLILEYAVSAAGVAQGWSKNFNRIMRLCGMQIPTAISSPPWAFDPDTGDATPTGSAFDLVAIVVVFVVTLVLVRGIKESASVNAGMVALKVFIVVFVILVGMAYIDNDNYSPFLPYGFFGISFFGYTAVGQSDKGGNAVGVLAGAGVVFFAYIGFDAVTTSAEECKNPQRDLPIGIIGSLVISTVLYIGVSIVLVGMVPYDTIDRDAPISAAFGAVGLKWAEGLVSVGALAGLSSVLLVNLMGQPRILMSMARDGLLPREFFTAVHPVYKTPYKVTILTGVCVALTAALIPLSVLVELVSMGTLMAFAFVNISVVLLRRYQPNLRRPFLCPCMPYLPLSGAAICFMLMISLPSANWVRLFVWFFIGICIYWNYGRLHVIEDKNVINSSASLQSVRRAMDISKDKVIDNLKSLRRQDVATQPESKTLKTTDRFPLLPAGSGSHQNSYPAPASNYTQYLKVKLQADTTSLIR